MNPAARSPRFLPSLLLSVALAAIHPSCATPGASGPGEVRDSAEAPVRAASESADWLSLKDVLPTHDIRVVRLSNGLELVLAPMPDVPLVALQTWVKSGSSDDPRGRSGMAALLERLMFRGTPRFGARELYRRLTGRGAIVASQTMRDYTLFEEQFAPDLLEEVLELEADRLSNLREGMTEEGLALMRMAAIEEHGMRLQTEPSTRMDEALWAMAFREHPYRLPILGIPEELFGITLEEARTAFDRRYAPSNITVVVTGNIEPDRLLPRLRKLYGAIPDRSKGERPVRRREPPGTEERRWVLRGDVVSPRIAIGYPITSANDPETAALDVASNLLFEGPGGVMRRRLVGDSGIALAVSGLAFTPREPGLLWTRVTLKPGISLERAEAEIDAVFGELSKTPPSEKEVSATVRQLTLDWLALVRTPGGLARMLGSASVMFGDPMKYRQDLERYVRVRPREVSEALHRHIDPNRRAVVLVLPEEAAEKPLRAGSGGSSAQGGSR